MNILFVDDEPNILRGLRRSLHSNRKRWSMFFAEGAEKALELLTETKMDILVTDMRMPGLSGQELAAKLKERHPEILCIGLSGYCKPSENLDSPTLFHQFWNKPCRQDFIVGNLERIEKNYQTLKPQQREWLIGLRNLPADSATLRKLVDELNAACPDYEELRQLTEADVALHAKLVQLGSSSFCGPSHQAQLEDFSSLLQDEIAQQLFMRDGLFSPQEADLLTASSRRYKAISQRAQSLARAAGASDWVPGCAAAAAQLAGLSSLLTLAADSPFSEEEPQSLGDACRFLLAAWGVNPTLSQGVNGVLEPDTQLTNGSQPEHFTSLATLMEDGEGKEAFVKRQLQAWGIEEIGEQGLEQNPDRG